MVGPDDASEVSALRERVRLLEDRVQALRASRRVLMSLISVQERAARAKISQLEQENRRLQQRNYRFAQAMLEKNARLLRLQEQYAQRPTDGVAGSGSSWT